MSRFGLGSILLSVLLLASLIGVPAVKAWSEVVVTEPWSEVESTEVDSAGVEAAAGVEEQAPAVAPVPESDDFLLDFESLYGTWYIWTPSTFVNLYDVDDGDYAAHELVAGAGQGVVVINPDGTYSMSHAAWDRDEVVEGKWRLSFPREINGEVVQAIVLLDGLTGVNWAVAPSITGKIRLLYALDTVLWVFDSELYRDE